MPPDVRHAASVAHHLDGRAQSESGNRTRRARGALRRSDQDVSDVDQHAEQ